MRGADVVYLGVAVQPGGWEKCEYFHTTEANSRFTVAHIRAIFAGQLDRIYRLFPDHTCRVLREGGVDYADAEA